MRMRCPARLTDSRPLPFFFFGLFRHLRMIELIERCISMLYQSPPSPERVL